NAKRRKSREFRRFPVDLVGRGPVAFRHTTRRGTVAAVSDAVIFSGEESMSRMDVMVRAKARALRPMASAYDECMARSLLGQIWLRP
ncbi:MAG TPA: hypothetical protein VFW82_07985, partial [Dyella sp.]|nr:hypothetical protein [Dyella sp.]